MILPSVEMPQGKYKLSPSLQALMEEDDKDEAEFEASEAKHNAHMAALSRAQQAGHDEGYFTGPDDRIVGDQEMIAAQLGECAGGQNVDDQAVEEDDEDKAAGDQSFEEV